MKAEIIPEIVPDIKVLKEVLAKESPAGCKVKIPPLNRKCLRISKSFCFTSRICGYPPVWAVSQVHEIRQVLRRDSS